MDLSWRVGAWWLDPKLRELNSQLDSYEETSKGRTKQEFKDDCDINLILERAGAAGFIGRTIDQEPLFGDFADSVDYREAVDIVRRADEQFSSLEARVRSRFDNDPEKFLAFMNDPSKNGEEMVKLGLAHKNPAPEVSMADHVAAGLEKHESSKRDRLDKAKADLRKAKLPYKDDSDD